MELRHLKYFLAVAEHEHVHQAAERLHVAQPTLSQQIRQLEREVGSPLFSRIGRGIRLTQAGTLFRDHCRRVLREVEHAQQALDELAGLRRGHLTVGVVQTVNACLIPPVVAGFSTQYPGIALRIEELSARDIAAGVAGGALDIGISFTPVALDTVTVEPLFTEELVLVVPPAHRFAGKRSVALNTLADEPLILMPERFGTRRLIDSACASAGFNPIAAIEMNSIAAIIACVRHGPRATILPRLALPAAVAAAQVVRLTAPTPTRQVGILRRRDGIMHQASERFVDLLTRAVRQRRAPTR